MDSRNQHFRTRSTRTERMVRSQKADASRGWIFDLPKEVRILIWENLVEPECLGILGMEDTLETTEEDFDRVITFLVDKVDRVVLRANRALNSEIAKVLDRNTRSPQIAMSKAFDDTWREKLANKEYQYDHDFMYGSVVSTLHQMYTFLLKDGYFNSPRLSLGNLEKKLTSHFDPTNSQPYPYPRWTVTLGENCSSLIGHYYLRTAHYLRYIREEKDKNFVIMRIGAVGVRHALKILERDDWGEHLKDYKGLLEEYFPGREAKVIVLVKGTVDKEDADTMACYRELEESTTNREHGIYFGGQVSDEEWEKGWNVFVLDEDDSDGEEGEEGVFVLDDDDEDGEDDAVHA